MAAADDDGEVAIEAAGAEEEGAAAEDNLEEDEGEEADAEDNGEADEEGAGEARASRKALKRKLRSEQRAEWKAAQKAKKKQRRGGPRHKGPPLPRPDEAGDRAVPTSPEEVRAARAARKAAELENFRVRSGQGTTVVLDLEWEDAMQSKELRSLMQQVLYCYGANRRASHPVRLVFSGVSSGSQTHAGLSKQAGYEAWEVQKLEGPYIEAFPSEKLVYLTADSKEVLHSFDPEKVYIIGGIVDRNRLKGHTMDKAVKQGIATAQLPLSEHIEMGTYSRVLAVNHVLNMILDHQASGDWRGVCERCVPGRKKFIGQGETETAADAGPSEEVTEKAEPQEVTTG